MHLNANGSISLISTQAESTAIVLNASYPTFDASAARTYTHVLVNEEELDYVSLLPA
jgi:hypothetical protein